MSKKSVFLFLFIIQSLISLAQKPDAILGNWMSENKDKIVHIYKANDLYYGKVVWVKDSSAGKGADRLDIKNPNASLNNRKIIGINYLLSFAYVSDRNVWKDGTIYNYETGNSYSAKIHLSETGDLELTGYYGILWFLGRTQIWTRTNK